jgi:hypothetical protein
MCYSKADGDMPDSLLEIGYDVWIVVVENPAKIIRKRK